jgi:hypothetical protein
MGPHASTAFWTRATAAPREPPGGGASAVPAPAPFGAGLLETAPLGAVLPGAGLLDVGLVGAGSLGAGLPGGVSGGVLIGRFDGRPLGVPPAPGAPRSTIT